MMKKFKDEKFYGTIIIKEKGHIFIIKEAKEDLKLKK
jgi:hypothetical protein